VLTDGLRAVEKTVEIAVLDVSEKNFEPIFSPMEAQSAVEGEALELPLEVVDVDGDNLVFTSPNLPEGAELDVYDGVLRWKPGPRQAGRYPGIVVEVFDGRRRVKGTVEIVVEDRVRAVSPRDDVALALRAPAGRTRAQALRQVKDFARAFQFLEAARLLRDRSAEVRGEALGILRKLLEEADAAFVAMMIRDLAPHAWHFTDRKEILQFLETLVSRGAASDPSTRTLRAALKGIEKYNKDRGL
jgi:hypothetical protein